MIFRTMRLLVVAFCALSTSAVMGSTVDARQDIKNQVDAAVQTVMSKYQIPGMAVGVIVEGKPYVFDYGVASTETKQPITHDTLFEIGSISKTFTATPITGSEPITGSGSLNSVTENGVGFINP